MEIGMILGRFQVFHNGHKRYLLEAMKFCDHIIIGITNPDPMQVKQSKNAVHRSQEISNPLTYYERMEMIEGVCAELKISKEEYDIVPIPLDIPENIKYYIPNNIFIMITIHDDWSLEKKSRLERQGYKIKVLFNEYGIKKLNSTDIRKLIMEGKEYQMYVPDSVCKYLTTHNIRERMLKIMQKEVECCTGCQPSSTK